MDAASIREGMSVFSADDQRLGKIVRRDGALFVEKGLFFKKDHLLDPDDVDRIAGDDLWLSLDRAAFEVEGARDEEIPGEPTERAIPIPTREGLNATPREPDIVVIIEEDDEILITSAQEDEEPELGAPGRSGKDPTTRH
jgi:hypothetical protein